MARVKKIMLTDEPTLKKEAKAGEAAGLLLKSQHGCVVVVDNGFPVGIVTELDILKNMSLKGNALKRTVDKIMSYPVATMSSSTSLEEALKIIDEKKFRKYPVVENNKFVGIVTKKDIVQTVSKNIRFHRSLQDFVLILFVLF